MEINESVRKIIKVLNLKGYEAYVVGGAVRDSIMGRTPHDYDVATNALPEQIKNTFPKKVAIFTRD